MNESPKIIWNLYNLEDTASLSSVMAVCSPSKSLIFDVSGQVIYLLCIIPK